MMEIKSVIENITKMLTWAKSLMRKDQESKVINTINGADNNVNIYYTDNLSNTVSMIIIPTPYALPIIMPMHGRLSNSDMRKLLQSHYYVLP